MLTKWNTLNKILDSGIVAVVRAEDCEKAERAADACLEADIHVIEIAFTVPFAHEVINSLARKYPSDILTIGAGTVLDPETARIAILSGAQYIVTPSVNSETIKLCNRYQVPTMAGAMTIREIIEALEAGSEIVKLFPGETVGPSFIKAARGPLPYASLMPTGGVSLDNVIEWFKAGAVAVGVGGSLTAGVRTGDYKSVTEIGKKYIEKIKEFRSE